MEIAERTRQPMKRIAVYLPDGIFESLERHANEEGRPISNLAAFLIEASLRELKPMKVSGKAKDKNTQDSEEE